MSDEIGALKITLSADTTDVEAALDRVKEKMEAVTVAATAAQAALDTLNRSYRLIGGNG